MEFEVIDVSGDVGIRAFGSTLKEVFINAGKGMFSLVTDLDRVREKKTIRTTLKSHSLEGLLVSWLNELIFYFDAYGFIGKGMEIKELTDSEIDAVAIGEDFDPERHERRLLIKAATYHNLKVAKKNGLWEADIIFDI